MFAVRCTVVVLLALFAYTQAVCTSKYYGDTSGQEVKERDVSDSDSAFTVYLDTNGLCTPVGAYASACVEEGPAPYVEFQAVDQVYVEQRGVVQTVRVSSSVFCPRY